MAWMEHGSPAGYQCRATQTVHRASSFIVFHAANIGATQNEQLKLHKIKLAPWFRCTHGRAKATQASSLVYTEFTH